MGHDHFAFDGIDDESQDRVGRRAAAGRFGGRLRRFDYAILDGNGALLALLALSGRDGH